MPNNTVQRQWLYIQLHIPLIFLCKMGVTNNIKQRTRTISETTFGYTVPVFFGRVWAAYYFEQFMLDTTSFLKYRMRGSGGSEWRMFVLPLVWPVFLAYWIVNKSFWFLVIFASLLFMSDECGDVLKSLGRLIF